MTKVNTATEKKQQKTKKNKNKKPIVCVSNPFYSLNERSGLRFIVKHFPFLFVC